MSCNLTILYGFSVMIQKQFFAYFSYFPRMSNISIRKTHEKIRKSYSWKWFKIWNDFVKEFASEEVEATYIARTILIFYSYLKICVWLWLEAVTLPITSASCERSFSKMKLLKTFPRNSMTSERLGNVDLSGVSRVWQAWHMPWASLWRVRKNCLAKLISLFTVSWTYILRPMHSLNCKAASTPRPHLKHNVGRAALAPLSIMTKLGYCDITRGPDIATEQERSRAMSTRPRPSHAIRKDTLVCTAAFQASRY